MTEVPSPITGSVWKVLVQPGSEVSEGDIVVILESMKMEIWVKSPCGGKVVELKVKEGDLIFEDDIVAIVD